MAKNRDANAQIEIRLLIWEYALPPPRIVFLSPWETPAKRTDEETQDDIRPVDRLHSSALWTVIQDVCHESREVVCQAYTKTFSTAAANSTGHTWFGYKRDILYIDWGFLAAEELAQSDFLQTEAALVEHLAVYDYQAYCKEDIEYEIFLNLVLSTFRNLKRLTIVAAQVHLLGSQLVARQLLPYHTQINFDFLSSTQRGMPRRVDNDIYHWNHWRYDRLVDLGRLTRHVAEFYRRTNVDGNRSKLAMPAIPAIDYQIMVGEETVEAFDAAVASYVALPGPQFLLRYQD